MKENEIFLRKYPTIDNFKENIRRKLTDKIEKYTILDLFKDISEPKVRYLFEMIPAKDKTIERMERICGSALDEELDFYTLSKEDRKLIIKLCLVLYLKLNDTTELKKDNIFIESTINHLEKESEEEIEPFVFEENDVVEIEKGLKIPSAMVSVLSSYLGLSNEIYTFNAINALKSEYKKALFDEWDNNKKSFHFLYSFLNRNDIAMLYELFPNATEEFMRNTLTVYSSLSHFEQSDFLTNLFEIPLYQRTEYMSDYFLELDELKKRKNRLFKIFSLIKVSYQKFTNENIKDLDECLNNSKPKKLNLTKNNI